MNARQSHTWRLKPGWKQFYHCIVCGVDDIHPKASMACKDVRGQRERELAEINHELNALPWEPPLKRSV